MKVVTREQQLKLKYALTICVEFKNYFDKLTVNDVTVLMGGKLESFKN